MRKKNKIVKLLNFIFKITFCKIGLHNVKEYGDKLREGEFYCKICGKNMIENYENSGFY